MRDWKLGEVLVVSAIVAGFACLLLVNAAQMYGTPFFGPEAGLFDAIMGVFTLLALIAGGIGAFLSYRAALQSIDAARVKDEWEQFRSGVQLLGASTDAETIAGIDILTHLAASSPKKFELLTFNVLRSYAHELSGDAKRGIWENVGGTSAHVWAKADVPEAHAFLALGILATRMTTRPELAADMLDGRLYVSNVLLVGRVIFGHPFRKIHVEDMAVDRVTFSNCDFRGAKLSGRAKSVTFDRCDLTDVDLQLQLTTAGTPPKFENCKIDGARIFDRSLADWIAKSGS